MSYNARVRARQNRAGGLYGQDRGWEVGSNQGGAIGIPARLVRKVNEKTTPINYDGNGVKRDDRNLVVQQNTLSGVGRWRSQFNVDADGIVPKRYYLGEDGNVCSTVAGSDGNVVCPVGQFTGEDGDVFGFLDVDGIVIGKVNPQTISIVNGPLNKQLIYIVFKKKSATERRILIRATDAFENILYTLIVTTHSSTATTSSFNINEDDYFTSDFTETAQPDMYNLIGTIMAGKIPFRVKIIK